MPDTLRPDPTPQEWDSIYDGIRDTRAKRSDIVNSPTHYRATVTKNGQSVELECIDAMVAVYGLKRVQEYCELSAFKYQWREGQKHEDPNNDKRKKIWFTRFSMGDDPRNDNV